MSNKYTFTIVVSGIGGEISVGEVDKATYDYFNENNIDIEDYYNDWDNQLNVPEEHQFVEPGSFYSCSDLAHESGCEVHESNEIEVYNEKNKLVWSRGLDISILENDGVKISQLDRFDRDDESIGTCIFIGKSIEKGTFINKTITTGCPFDPKKLKLNIDVIDDWSLLTYLEYEDKVEDEKDHGPDTVGKDFELEIFRVGE